MARRRGSGHAERCAVCQYEKVGIVNYMLAKGVTAAAVAREHGLVARSVQYHREHHIPENYRKIISSGIYADLDELLRACVQGDAESLDILNALISGFFHSWSLAFSNGSQSQMVQYSSQLRHLIELRAKITHELAPAQHLHGHLQINNFQADNATMIAGIAKALTPYPAAKQAVLAFLRPDVIEHAAAD
jgi:hypothetical protein